MITDKVVEEIKSQARQELINELKDNYIFSIPMGNGWEEVVRFESIKKLCNELGGCKHL